MSTAGRRDDREEFEATCFGLRHVLFGVAVRLTRRPEDARDLVQETFLRAYRSFRSFEAGTNAKAWLLTILYSVFVNAYRKRSREPRNVSVDDVDEKFLASHDGPLPADLDVVTDQEVEQALAALPEAFRSAVLMVDIRGLTYDEASAVLACPVGTLRSRLFRARRQLFVSLREYARKAAR